jgi:hypothetical protein
MLADSKSRSVVFVFFIFVYFLPNVIERFYTFVYFFQCFVDFAFLLLI